MSKTIWRVEWNIAGGPRTSFELRSEEKALEWAEGLLEGGATGIVLTELIVGRTIHFSAPAPMFEK